MKKIISLILALLIMTAAAPAAVGAEGSTPIEVYVTIADEGKVVMAQEKVAVSDVDSDGVITVDEVLAAAHEVSYEGGAEAGYATENSAWGLSITKLWGNTSGSYGYWLNNASCWSLSDVVSDGDYLVAFTYKSLDPWDSYAKLTEYTYTATAGEAFDVALEIAGYDENWNTVFVPHAGAEIIVLDKDLGEIADYTATDNGDGVYSVTVDNAGEYFVAAYDDSVPTVPAVSALTVNNAPASPIDVRVTIADEGKVVMAQEKVAVSDVDSDGVITVDEVLAAAHEVSYEGGAEAGYATENSAWGLSITKLWGNTSGSYGYWLNNASCWSLSDVVSDGDYLVAFTYKSLDPWDSYAKLTEYTYDATAGEPFEVALEIAGYDANWNTVFESHAGAEIKVLDKDLKEITGYAATDNGDGTYTVTVDNAGEYFVAAYDDSVPTVPAVSALHVGEKKADPREVYEAAAEYMISKGTPSVGSVGGEWTVIGLVRGGYDCPEGYYENVKEYVNEKINGSEQLHRAKSTDNSRVILALTACGYDVTNVAGHDLTRGLTDMDYVKKQGISGPVWALIALDSHGYEIPEDPDSAKQVTREGLVAHILSRQLGDGGWSASGTVSDPDMTAMAITSLAPYYGEEDVRTAVDGALSFLSGVQADDGSFGSVDGKCAESCAAVTVALTSLGIDPDADERFIKNGNTVIDALCSFALECGGFSHVPGDEVNGMATEQGAYALAAYLRFKDGKTALFDMSDVEISKVLPGDVDGDGVISMKDVLALRKVLAGAADLPEWSEAGADVNGDGAVNMKDVLTLRKILAGSEE